MIITIDGPSGSGKSTVAHRVADKLGFAFLDTGALYRAVAAALHMHGISFEDSSAVSQFIYENPLDILCDRGTISYSIGGHEVSDLLRSDIATRGASLIARYPSVRAYLLPIQRALAHHQNIVCEGRDMGTVVFPQADIKIFLDADPTVRAQRRFLEKKSPLLFENILSDMLERDKNDRERELAPLQRAEDAFLIDTTHHTLDEVVNDVLNIIRGHIPKYTSPGSRIGFRA